MLENARVLHVLPVTNDTYGPCVINIHAYINEAHILYSLRNNIIWLVDSILARADQGSVKGIAYFYVGNGKGVAYFFKTHQANSNSL